MSETPNDKNTSNNDTTPDDKSTPPKKDDKVWTVTDLPSAEDLRKMTENIPTSAEDIRKKTEEARRNASPEVNEAIDKTVVFVNRYKQELAYALIGLVFLRLYKKRISRKTTEKILKTLATTGAGAPGSLAPNGTNYPTLFEIVEELRAAPGMAYIPHGGGMVHLLKGKDALITILGDFENMTNKEIWDRVANVLNLGVTATR